jgi:hypothetical protein
MSEPHDPSTERRPLRLPIEMPRPAGVRDSRALGLSVSVAVHVLIVLALVLPFAFSPAVRSAIARGAGGAGPAGGGGGRGGSMANMRDRERLRFVRVAPAAQPPPTQVDSKPPVVPPPQPQPEPTPIETPPAKPPEEPQPEQQVSTATGAGTGNEGSGGAGPGSGGGVGSGIGTGRGSAMGPGTGGGADSVYPPTMIETFLPPYPIPSKIRPYELIASFEIDSTGRIVAFEFNETRDRGYNRKLRETLTRIRFRPGVRADGTPVRTRYELKYDI